MKTQKIEVGNIGVITSIDSLLCEVTKVEGEIVYCDVMEYQGCFRCCHPEDFWILLDSFPA